MSKYPSISTGLGEFTPAIWDRWMKMLYWFEENNLSGQDFNTLHRRLLNLENRTDWFFAKLLRAHVLDETLQNPNVYEYAWVRVYPEPGVPGCSVWPAVACDATTTYQGHFVWKEDMKLTSWAENVPETGGVGEWTSGDYDDGNPYGQPCVSAASGDGNAPPCHTIPYTAPGINISEAHNTAHHASPGTDETKGVGDFMMQAIGGGDTVLDYPITDVCDIDTNDPWEPCTQLEFPLFTRPIVMMWIERETDGTTRYVFQAENAYDGTCSECIDV